MLYYLKIHKQKRTENEIKCKHFLSIEIYRIFSLALEKWQEHVLRYVYNGRDTANKYSTHTVRTWGNFTEKKKNKTNFGVEEPTLAR